MQLSSVSQSTPPSGIRQIFNRIAESGDVISFALGEPDFDTPPPVIAAAYEALESKKTHYTPNAGLYALRSSIAGLYKNRTPEQIVVTAGATEALLLTLLTLLNPGDEIVLAAPYWPTYLGQINACGAVPRFVRTREEDGFCLKAAQVEAVINSRTRMLLLNSPSNPTGAVIPLKDLEDLARLAVKHDLIVLSDEVYRHIVYEESFCSIADLPGMAERCIIIDSFSKAYAMTGWRVGYIVAPKPVAEVMASMHEYTVSCIPAPTQMAALKALEVGRPYMEKMVEEFAQRRRLVVEGIRNIDRLSCRLPSGAFYLYINIVDTGLDAKTFVYSLLEKEKVALAPGDAFGDGQEHFVRMCYAASQDTLREGIRRITAFVSRLPE